MAVNRISKQAGYLQQALPNGSLFAFLMTYRRHRTVKDFIPLHETGHEFKRPPRRTKLIKKFTVALISG